MVSAASGREDLVAARRCTRPTIEYETLMQHVLRRAMLCSHPVAAARFLDRHSSASGLDECGDTYGTTTGHDTVSFS